MGEMTQRSAGTESSTPQATQTIGMRIRAHRAALGMSQEELARACWVSRPTISNWECGKTMPNAEDVALLAAAFDVAADDLLQGIAPIAARMSADRRELQTLFCAWWMSLALAAVCIAAWWDAGHPLAGWQFAAAIGSCAAMLAPLARAHIIARRHALKTDHQLVAYALGSEPRDDLTGRPTWKRFMRRHGTAFGIGSGIVQYLLLGYLVSGPAAELPARLAAGAVAIALEAALLCALCHR